MASIKSPLYKHGAVSHELGEIIDQVSHAADVGCDGLDSGNELLISPAQGARSGSTSLEGSSTDERPGGWTVRARTAGRSRATPSRQPVAVWPNGARYCSRSRSRECPEFIKVCCHWLRQQAGHMDAPLSAVSADFPLTPEGPSTTSPHHQRNIFQEDGQRPLTP